MPKPNCAAQTSKITCFRYNSFIYSSLRQFQFCAKITFLSYSATNERMPSLMCASKELERDGWAERLRSNEWERHGRPVYAHLNYAVMNRAAA